MLALDERIGHVYVRNVELPKVSVKFAPYNFSIYNNYPENTNPIEADSFLPTYPTSGNCLEVIEDLDRHEPTLDPIDRFFSAGELFNMPSVKENRIFGDLSIKGIKFKNLKINAESIKLIVKYGYNYSNKISVPLSSCIKNKYFNLGPVESDLFINKYDNSHLSGYLFSISNLMLGLVPTTENSKVKMYVQIEMLNNEGHSYLVNSSSTLLAVLKSPTLPVNKVSGCKDSFDEAIGGGCLRTGGDKWILPAYSDTIKSIVSETDWSVNDMAKSNGGIFAGHKSTHVDGLDADVRYDQFNFKNFGYLNYVAWDESLKKIEDFIRDISLKVPNGIEMIRSIYISSDVKTERRIAPIYKRFDNRCMDFTNTQGFTYQRIIDLEAKNGEGSVLKYAPLHWHHLHIRFNHVTPSGGKNVIPINSGSSHYQVNLNDLLFFIDESGSLSVEIRPDQEDNYKDVMVVWRYQDKEGFDDLSMNMQSGRIGDKPEERFGHVLNSSSSIRYLYVSVARIGSGQCGRVGPIAIDIQQKGKIKNGRWF